MKPSSSPQQDYTNYLITINDQLKAFGLLNPLKTCFSNKKLVWIQRKMFIKAQTGSGTAQLRLLTWGSNIALLTPPVSSGRDPSTFTFM